jgi:hypothetical protein
MKKAVALLVMLCFVAMGLSLNGCFGKKEEPTPTPPPPPKYTPPPPPANTPEPAKVGPKETPPKGGKAKIGGVGKKKGK